MLASGWGDGESVMPSMGVLVGTEIEFGELWLVAEQVGLIRHAFSRLQFTTVYASHQKGSICAPFL